MKQTLKIIFLSALATAALIKGVPALAEPADQVVAVIEVNDLDFSTASGRRLLQKRISVAAHTVCDTASPVDLQGRNGQSECRQQVTEQARARINEAAKAPRSILVAANR